MKAGWKLIFDAILRPQLNSPSQYPSPPWTPFSTNNLHLHLKCSSKPLTPYPPSTPFSTNNHPLHPQCSSQPSTLNPPIHPQSPSLPEASSSSTPFHHVHPQTPWSSLTKIKIKQVKYMRKKNHLRLFSTPVKDNGGAMGRPSLSRAQDTLANTQPDVSKISWSKRRGSSVLFVIPRLTAWPV